MSTKLNKFRKPYEVILQQLPEQIAGMPIKINSASYVYCLTYLVPFKNQYNVNTTIKIPINELLPNFKKTYFLQYRCRLLDDNAKKAYFELSGISIMPLWKVTKMKNIYHSVKIYIFSCYGSNLNYVAKKSLLKGLEQYMQTKPSLFQKIEAILNNELEKVYFNITARQCKYIYVTLNSNKVRNVQKF